MALRATKCNLVEATPTCFHTLVAEPLFQLSILHICRYCVRWRARPCLCNVALSIWPTWPSGTQVLRTLTAPCSSGNADPVLACCCCCRGCPGPSLYTGGGHHVDYIALSWPRACKPTTGRTSGPCLSRRTPPPTSSTHVETRTCCCNPQTNRTPTIDLAPKVHAYTPTCYRPTAHSTPDKPMRSGRCPTPPATRRVMPATQPQRRTLCHPAVHPPRILRQTPLRARM